MDRQQRRAHRRDGLECDFRRHEERRSVLHDKLERATAAHKAAKAALAAAEAALERAEQLYAGAEQDCAELQHLMTLDPDTVNGLPVELLAAVFVTIAHEPDPMWQDIEDARYNDTRAMLPDHLAAVCRHWRTVALSTSSLWSYVALPLSWGITSEERSNRIAWVALRLERSRSSPIDVCFDFMVHPDHYNEDLAYQRELVSLIIDRASRWRRVKVRLPLPPPTFEQLISQKQLPVLEELCLSDYATTAPDFMDVSWLSRVPTLRKLCSPNIQLELSTSAGSIVSASLAVFSTFSALHKLPSLESLSLTIGGLPDTVTGPVSLPALKFLKLRGDDVLDRFLAMSMSAPRLDSLNLRGHEFALASEPSVQAFVHAFPGITNLEIEVEWWWPYHHSPPNAILEPFSRLKTLTLTENAVPNYLTVLMGGVEDTPAARLRVCPGLISLTIRNAPKEIAHILPSLSRFIWERAAACRVRREQFRVSFESLPSKLPTWFRQVLAAALGPSNVRLTSSYGMIYDLVEDSDEEEAEAEFTDSDESFTASDDSEDDSGSSSPEDGAQCLRANGSEWETDSEDVDYVDEDD